MRASFLLKGLWGLLGGILALLIFLPLSWVGPKILPETFTLDNTQYKGTVWRGVIENLRDTDLVAYSLNPHKILLGQPPITAKLKSTGLDAKGALSRKTANDLSMQIDVSALPIPDPRLRGLAGRVDVRVINAQWSPIGACRKISGVVQSDVLMRNRGLFNWTGPSLKGPISCDSEGQYLFTLTGSDPIQNIQALISISATGQYTTDMRVTTRDAEAALALPLFGFDEKGRSSDGLEFRLVEQGQWR